MAVRHEAEKGFALISVVVAGSLVLLTLLVAITFAQLSSKLVTLQLSYAGQALNTANAGLEDGLGWFVRQGGTVQAFNPRKIPTANPPVDDTDIQTVPRSIQRDFPISAPGRVWGHYELRAGAMVPGSKTVATGVFDMTPGRRGGAAGHGAVWQLQSTGAVYVRNTTDMTVAYNQLPNKVLSTQTLRSEISRFGGVVPSAAVSIQSCSSAGIGSTPAGLSGAGPNARVLGGPSAPGVACRSSSGSPVVGSGATLSGTPASTGGLNTNSFRLYDVFGVSTLADLAGIADVNVTSAAGLPANMPAMQIVIINAGAGVPVQFTTVNPLQGSGILVVVGDLTLSGGSTWNGIVYVMGNVTITAPASVYGTVIVANTGATATITGGSGTWAEVYYDPFILAQIAQQIGQYRFSRSAYVPVPDPVNDPFGRKRLAGNRETGF